MFIYVFLVIVAFVLVSQEIFCSTLVFFLLPYDITDSLVDMVL